MEEAKFSSNIKYQYQGYECQFTMRADTGSASELLDTTFKAIAWLEAHGASTRNGNGSVHPVKKEPESAASAKPPQKRLCPVCGLTDQLRLIEFTPKGATKSMAKFKCERCNKWLPNGTGIPTQEELEAHKVAVCAQATKDIKELWH